MVKHWPGGGSCESGRDAHFALSKRFFIKIYIIKCEEVAIRATFSRFICIKLIVFQNSYLI